MLLMIGTPLRPASPAGGSIFVTSAPRLRRILVQCGPASTRVKSMTRSPFSGAFISVALEYGGTRARRRKGRQPALLVVAGPHLIVHLGLPRIGAGEAMAGRQVRQHLDRAERNGWPGRELACPGQSRGGELRFGHDEIDDAPALERRGIVAPAEYRHLLGARGTGALDDALHAAEQGDQAQRRLGHAEGGGIGSQDHVAGKRQLEAAAERGTVHGRDRRQRHILQRADELLEALLVAPSAAIGEAVHISAGAKMPHVAAPQYASAALVHSAAVGGKQFSSSALSM